MIVPTLREHLAAFAGDDPGALVFPGAKGGPLRRGNFNKMSARPHARKPACTDSAPYSPSSPIAVIPGPWSLCPGSRSDRGAA